MRKTNSHGNGIAALVACALCLCATAAGAEEPAPARVWGSIGIGQRFIDESGPMNMYQQRNDLHDGFAFRDLDLHVQWPQRWMLDLAAPRLDETAHDVRLSVRGSLARASLHTAATRYFYDPNGETSARRRLLDGSMEIRPMRRLELFGDGGHHERSGARAAVVAGDEGMLGTLWDQSTRSWRGGARIHGLRSTLQVSMLGRQLRSDVLPELDRDTRGTEVSLRSRPLPPVHLQGTYAHARTEVEASGVWLESDRVAAGFDVDMRRGWSAGPRFRFEQTTDAADGFTSKIWAAGAGAARGGERWTLRTDAEGGRREDAGGGAGVWGASGLGALRLARGVRLEASATRRERQRDDTDALRVDGRLVSTAGTLSSQKVETRLRLQRGARWNGALRLARLDKEYGDVGTQVRTWRYGVDAGCTPARGVRLDAGWHLDDAADEAATGGYALRSRTLYGAVALEPARRLQLRGRVDLLDTNRDLEVRKAAVSAGLDLEVRPALFLGAEYENGLYDDERGTSESYRAHVVSVSLRRGFRW